MKTQKKRRGLVDDGARALDLLERGGGQSAGRSLGDLLDGIEAEIIAAQHDGATTPHTFSFARPHSVTGPASVHRQVRDQ